ncbi:hypothetical protein D1872_268300 [compost metagenome]
MQGSQIRAVPACQVIRGQHDVMPAGLCPECFPMQTLSAMMNVKGQIGGKAFQFALPVPQQGCRTND